MRTGGEVLVNKQHLWWIPGGFASMRSAAVNAFHEGVQVTPGPLAARKLALFVGKNKTVPSHRQRAWASAFTCPSPETHGGKKQPPRPV